MDALPAARSPAPASRPAPALSARSLARPSALARDGSPARAGPRGLPPLPLPSFSPQRRLREEGADRLSTPDLLEVLLAGESRDPPRGGAASGSEGTAGEPRTAARESWALLERFESLRRIAAGSVLELVAAGLPHDGALRVAAAFALGRRAAGEVLRRGSPFVSSLDIFERYHPLLRDARRERFVAVLLDGKNRVMRDEWVSEGSLTSSLVHPREVFARAIRESAGAMVFVHNHPSGDPEPSPEDVEVTRRLCSVGEIVGIRVLDHVVIGEGAYVSFLDRGWIGAG